MKILYFSQFYTPESIAAAFRASDNARIWADNGHDVTVFTGYPNYPTGRIFPGYDMKMLREEWDSGVRLLRSKLIIKPNTNMLRRIVNALSFFWFGLWNLLLNRRKVGFGHDVVLATSGTIFSALLGWVYAFCHRIPYVFEIRDITYRQMMATGKNEKSLGVKAMRALELFLCNQAARIVVVTHGFKKLLSDEGVPSEKIDVITNGVDIKEPPTAQQHQDRFTLSYFGTLGISQNIQDTFPYAEKIAECCDQFQFLIIGEGAQFGRIEECIQSGAYPFVELMHGMSAEALEEYYAGTCLSLVTLIKNENFRYTLPSKLFQVMGRGIAVLFIGPDGEAADIVRRYDAGIVLTGCYEDDCAYLKQFFSNENWYERLKQMGKNGAEAVKEHYSRNKLALRYLQLLSECVEN